MFLGLAVAFFHPGEANVRFPSGFCEEARDANESADASRSNPTQPDASGGYQVANGGSGRELSQKHGYFREARETTLVSHGILCNSTKHQKVFLAMSDC